MKESSKNCNKIYCTAQGVKNSAPMRILLGLHFKSPSSSDYFTILQFRLIHHINFHQIYKQYSIVIYVQLVDFKQLDYNKHSVLNKGLSRLKSRPLERPNGKRERNSNCLGEKILSHPE